MFTQANRLLALTTSLGEDTLLIREFSGSEQLGGGFEYHLEMIAENEKAGDVSADAIVGTLASVSVALDDAFDNAPVRFFNGVVTDFSQGAKDDRFTEFSATLRPWTWLLGLQANCRVFQDMNVLDIVKQMFDDLKGKFSDLVNFKDETTGSYTAYDYLIQYNETDLNFVQRLLAQEGIYWYVEHVDGKHTVVLVDSNDSHPTLAEQSTLNYDPEISYGDGRKATVVSWQRRYGMKTGKFIQRDNNFQMPSKTLEMTEAGVKKIGGSDKLEKFHYGSGAFSSKFNKPDERMGDVEPEGSKLSKAAIESLETSHIVCTGSSISRELSVGYGFALDGHHVGAENTDYIVTEIQHYAVQTPDYVSYRGTETTYSCQFTCQPKDVQLRLVTDARRPSVHGVQRAVVVGPSGEEIWTDKYGRIRVQFPWDREGESNEESTCWLRVVQPMAGQNWGAHFWPRIGHEVLVGFLDGDIDQPIVTGSMYNSENMPPYDMPDNQTRSGIKTRSTKEGSDENFNELRFEDKKDEEEIYFHAEKDFNRVVENNDTLKVGFDKKDSGNQDIEIFNNQTITVGDSEAEDGNQDVTIFNNQTLKVGDAQASDGSQKVEIKKDRKTTIKEGDDLVNVKMGNRDVKIDMGNHTLKVAMGNDVTKVDLGKSTKEAMQSIELKVGSNSIKVDQMGVTIKGMMVKIEGTTMTEIKGMMTTVKGDAMLKLQGGLTMIN